MAIQVALNHRTAYDYDRPVTLGPQLVRLRPAPHARTPVLSYSLRVTPEDHFINWQQDPFGNFMARLVFPEKTRRFSVEVDLIADLTAINPFDFFVEPEAEAFPFDYAPWLRKELGPYLETDLGDDPTPRLDRFVAAMPKSAGRTVDWLIDLNQRASEEIDYLIRMEPGVQTPEQTLERGRGSCRDSAWLLVHALRRAGLAARFVSGYLIQLKPDVAPLEGPAGAPKDFTDLHAWCEVFLPGAGWIGLDPTSGLLAGEGHIPLAATPAPAGAAPITGGVDKAEVEFSFEMAVDRIVETPRVTKPYTDEQWGRIVARGREIDARLDADDVRLTMGGEPTFVSIDDMEGEEWTYGAVGATKRRMSDELVRRLRDRFAPGGLLHFGQGKWYPGEPLPRWAFACYWRRDGKPVWNDPALVADNDADGPHAPGDAAPFITRLAERLGVDEAFVVPAYEDAMHAAWKENRLPPNVKAGSSQASTEDDRRRLAEIFERGLDTPTGWVLPLGAPKDELDGPWITGPWPVRSEHMFLLPGDSPMGLRLPLESLTEIPEGQRPVAAPMDPMAARDPLPAPLIERHGAAARRPAAVAAASGGSAPVATTLEPPAAWTGPPPAETSDVVRTALCVEVRDGRLHVFMPPVDRLEHFLDLVGLIELTAAELETPVLIEGYPPPYDPRLRELKVTPDPGVIEVNVHPSESWDDLVQTTETLYEEARRTRLAAEKFDLDGKHTGTGGGAHVVLGAATPVESPFLRRPELMARMLTYWINHPSLSYLFSSRFIGPTSQAPRVDEGRPDALSELELALRTLEQHDDAPPPWLVDRVFRHLLTDLTGNTHRAEICIDKLYSPDSATGRLGLVELRGFEMPPHARMSLTQQLLVRALIAHFWRGGGHPTRMVNWGVALHDRFMLPHFLWEDLLDVLDDLRRDDLELDPAWFAPHFEFRFPRIGGFTQRSIDVELRHAVEPWYVLGEEPAGGGTSRSVDSSVERLQVRVDGLNADRYALACNGRRAPLHPTGVDGQYVAGVRYRAWAPPRCLHPTIPVHTPLTFDLVDLWQARSIGACQYHVSNPTGSNADRFPVNALEAESRRAARFFVGGHTPGRLHPTREALNPRFPMTLDLRRPATPG